VTIRETKTGRYATRKTRRYAITKTMQYAMKRTRRYATERMTQYAILKKWLPGASNRATIIYSTNLEISLAAPRSIYGRGTWFFLIRSARPEREKVKTIITEQNSVNKKINIFNKEKKGNGKA